MAMFNRPCVPFDLSPFVLWTGQALLYYFIYIKLSAFYVHSKLSIYQSFHVFVSISQTSSLNIHTGVNGILSSLLTLKTRSYINTFYSKY